MLYNFKEDMRVCIRVILFWAAKHSENAKEFDKVVEGLKELYKISESEENYEL